MSLLHPEEHLACFNYDNGPKPNIETVSMSSGMTLEINSIDNKIIIVTHGKLSVTYGEYVDVSVVKGNMFLLPRALQAVITATDEVTILVVRLRGQIQLCDGYMLDRLLCEAKSDYFGLKVLEANDNMWIFILGLQSSVKDGLKCSRYFELKLKELFYLFRAYYTKDNLLGFFQPLINQNYAFSNFVFQNHANVKSVKELAIKSGYSQLGFEKHFEKTFGMPAHTWLKDQKAKAIFRDICCGSRTFRDISASHNFSSPAHFNDFCKAHFGATPGKIREKNESENCFNVGNRNKA